MGKFEGIIFPNQTNHMGMLISKVLLQQDSQIVPICNLKHRADYQAQQNTDQDNFENKFHVQLL